jgi:ABC-type transport system substrate-binding protein
MGVMHMDPTTPLLQAFPVRVGNNASNYTDPRYKELVDAAVVEIDPAKRKGLFKQLTDLFLDESFCMPVTPNKRAWGTRAYVKGLDYSAYDRVLLEKVWLDK